MTPAWYQAFRLQPFGTILLDLQFLAGIPTTLLLDAESLNQQRTWYHPRLLSTPQTPLTCKWVDARPLTTTYRPQLQSKPSNQLTTVKRQAVVFLSTPDFPTYAITLQHDIPILDVNLTIYQP